MVHVLFVCLGNICRSPMAAAVFRHRVDEVGLADSIAVDSAGTGTWHIGEPPHHGTRDVLRRHGITHDHRARQVTHSDLRMADYVLAMDHSNLGDLRRLDREGVLDGKLHLLTDFAPPPLRREIPDPYFTGDFDEVFHLVEAATRGLLDHIRTERGL